MTSAPPPGPAPLDPVSDGSVTSPRGFAAAAVHAGLKADGALDVALLVSATSCATAGVFTRNAVRAAPVVYDAELLARRPGHGGRDRQGSRHDPPRHGHPARGAHH